MPTAPRPRLAIPRAVLTLRWVLFALLLAAAGAALLGLPRALQAGGSTALRVLPVALLVLFIAGYATYRFALAAETLRVQARRARLPKPTGFQSVINAY